MLIGWVHREFRLSCFGRLEVSEPVPDLRGNADWTAVLPDPHGHDASSCHWRRIGLAFSGVAPGLLEHDHGRAPELLCPGSDPQPVSKKHLAQVVHLDAHNMDRPAPLREYVIRKATGSQSLEAGLLEIVEMDGVIDVPEGVQLVGACLDYGLGDAQFPFALSSRQTRLGSPRR